MAESIFTTQTPAGQFNDGNSITLGTVFRSDVNGKVTGSRFFRSTVNPAGTFIGGLFTITAEGAGVELARVPYGATVAGWNTALFAAPVDIVAGTLYVAVYWSPRDYVASSNVFAAPITNGHLTAIQAGTPYANGRFAFPAADLVFPASSGNTANYFADVLFEPSNSRSAIETTTVADTATRILAAGRAVGDALTPAGSVAAAFAGAGPLRAAAHSISVTSKPALITATTVQASVRRTV